MEQIKYITILFSLIIANNFSFAQQDYTQIKNLFCINADSHWKLLDTADDLSFLMTPLTELKLDNNYILSDFRGKWNRNHKSKDISVLRLYVRDKKKTRPNDMYFDKEYSRYIKSKKYKATYKKNKNNVPYIWPFKKIRLKGTPMSIWQAYILDCSKSMFGMRNEANYNKEFFMTSPEDIDSIISLIQNTWDSDYFGNKIDYTKITKQGAKHINEINIVIDSLQNLKSKNLDPLFIYNADSVTIEHYSFLEFYGLVKCRTTLIFSKKFHHIKEIREKSYKSVARYRHYVFI